MELTLENAPLGTRAPANMGGYWERTEHGWKWFNGNTFPRPGGDWNGKLLLICPVCSDTLPEGAMVCCGVWHEPWDGAANQQDPSGRG